MKRHASADELADLAVGALRPRKAGKISAHLAGCAECTDVSSQLAGVSSMLASVPAAPMPAQFSVKIEAAIAAESAQRLASEPATEPGRRDLPAGGRRSQPNRQGWRIFGLSGPASRLVAAAGALVIIGVGGYAIATNIGTSTGPSGTASAGSAAAPATRLSFGPTLRVGEGAATKSLRTVSSDTNFTSSRLGVEVIAVLRAARQDRAVQASGRAVTNAPASAHASGQSQSTSPGQSPTASSQKNLTGCVDTIAAGRAVLLVELAKFDGQPATIIVSASVTASSADIWVVRPTCSAANTEILDHVRVART